MTGLTLKINTGSPLSLAQHGFQEVKYRALANAPGLLSITDKTRDITTTPRLAFDDVVKLYTGSTSSDGGTTWTGGALIFQGRVRVPADHGSGPSECQVENRQAGKR